MFDKKMSIWVSNIQVLPPCTIRLRLRLRLLIIDAARKRVHFGQRFEFGHHRRLPCPIHLRRFKGRFVFPHVHRTLKVRGPRRNLYDSQRNTIRYIHRNVLVVDK